MRSLKLNLCVAAVSALALTAGVASPSFAAMGKPMMGAEKTVMVGGAAMYPSKNIVENAVNSKDHTTLVAAVKAAGLPAGTVDTLVMPENKTMLTGILTYHVVAGRMTAADLMAAVKKGHGKAMLKTVNGQDLTVTQSGKTLMITDTKGGMAHVTIGDVMQSNGVIHVVDKVLMPS
jgi:uncharacterized surface protein with fasciclin (FAS1) repeats